MEIQIKYTRNVTSRKGNANPVQSGISLWGGITSVDIRAINPKTNNWTTNLRMEIPKENIQEVIDALKQFI